MGNLKLFFLLLVGAAAFAAAEQATAPPPQGAQGGPGNATPGAVVLYPPDGSVVNSELVLVMAVSPASRAEARLTLDGKALETERMGFAATWASRSGRLFPTSRPAESPSPGAVLLKDKSTSILLVGVAKLSPGRHVIGADGSEVKLHYSANADVASAPAGWPVYKAHPSPKEPADATACQKCHAMSEVEGRRALGLAKTPTSCEGCHDEIALQLAHRHVMDSLSKCQTCHESHGSVRVRLLTDTEQKLCTQCHEAGHSKR